MQKSPWLQLTAALALVGVACGAGAPPAAAEPRPRRAKPAAPAPRAKVLRVGAASAERVKKAWEVAAGGYARAVAVSAKLGRVAFASKDTVSLFNLQNGKPAGEVKRCRDVVHTGVGFHGRDLIIVCDQKVVVVDAIKLTPKPALPVSSARISAATLVGSKLALAHHDGVVRVLGLDGSAPVEVRVPGPPIDVKSLALTRDGTRLAVAWVQGSIWWWDLAKPDESHDLVRHESESDALAFDPGGTLLAEEGAKKTTTLWSLDGTPSEKATIRNGSWIKRLIFTPDGTWLVRGGSDGLELAEIGGPKRIALDTRSPVEDVALDENAVTLAAADRDGRLTLWLAK